MTPERLTCRVLAWALLADALPIYPLYALLFAEHGLSDRRISVLFAIWSLTSVLTSVPTGALADRFSRRGCLIAAGPLQAGAWLTWLLWPTFAGYAFGFVLWGLAGSLVAGAFEAWLWDALTSLDEVDRFAQVTGRVRATALLAQLAAAAVATALFPFGGYVAVVVASAAMSLLAAAMAASFPEVSRPDVGDDTSDGSIVLALRQLWTRPLLRRAILALAAVSGIDAIEEYFGLLAHSWGVPTGHVPAAIVAIPVIGAVGAWLGGRAARGSPRQLAALLGVGGALLAFAAALDRPIGLVAVAVYYGAYQVVDVVLGARLQAQIDASARATVTSVADLGTEVSVFAIYGTWALGGLGPTSAYILVVAVGLCLLVRGSAEPAG